jgi:hypothetical protein
MITSNTRHLFGGKTATIETQAFSCFISTAKEAFFQKQSMVIFDTTNGWENRRFVAKFLYNDILDKNARLRLHDAIIHAIDESGMNSVSLRQTPDGLFERLRKEGIGVGVIDQTL